jgi:hypothetical protein
MFFLIRLIADFLERRVDKVLISTGESLKIFVQEGTSVESLTPPAHFFPFGCGPFFRFAFLDFFRLRHHFCALFTFRET